MGREVSLSQAPWRIHQLGAQPGVVLGDEIHRVHQVDDRLQILRKLGLGFIRIVLQAERGEMPGILSGGAEEDRLCHGLMEIVEGGQALHAAAVGEIVLEGEDGILAVKGEPGVLL